MQQFSLDVSAEPGALSLALTASPDPHPALCQYPRPLPVLLPQATIPSTGLQSPGSTTPAQHARIAHGAMSQRKQPAKMETELL